MDASLRHLSPLRTSVPTRPPAAPSKQPENPEEEPLEASSKGAWLAGGLLGVSALGLLGTYAGSHLPICSTAQVQVCVPESLATPSATAWRYLQAPQHLADTLQSWQSHHHQVVAAPQTSSRATQADQLQVVSWNLHHGQSQDATGARPQLDSMIANLKKEDADILLLQEVAPGHVEELVEELGMQGYYAATTPVQGNLILLNPDIEVRQDRVVFTTGEVPGQAWDTLMQWVQQGGGAGEPRNLQLLEVELPGGREALIWNTHHLTGAYSPEQQVQAAESLGRVLQQEIAESPDRLVVGGGDLNATSEQADHPLVEQLQQLPGQRGQSHRLDWIVSNGEQQFSSQWVQQSDGTVVSDHPLVRSRVSQ